MGFSKSYEEGTMTEMGIILSRLFEKTLSTKLLDCPQELLVRIDKTSTIINFFMVNCIKDAKQFTYLLRHSQELID
jgi:hypothetical protein